MTWIFLGVLGAGALAALWAIGLYNALVASRNRYKNGYAQIDIQLKRRYDLIPNFVETVRGYMKHERETLEAVIAARNQAAAASSAAAAAVGNAPAMRALGQAESQLQGFMSRLLVVSESYPELKANATMAELQEELRSTENKLAFARQAYNDSVTSYNNACEQFPSSLLAGPFGFRQASLLEVATPAAREAPKVHLAAQA